MYKSNPTLEKIPLTSQKWDECIYRLRWGKKHSQLLFLLTALCDLHRFLHVIRSVEKRRRDWHSRKAQICDLLLFTGFNPFILIFVTFFCICTIYVHSIYDLNQLQCQISSLRNNERVCAADIKGLSYAEIQCIIFKKGNLHHCNCVLSCTIKLTLSTVYVSLFFLN